MRLPSSSRLANRVIYVAAFLKAQQRVLSFPAIAGQVGRPPRCPLGFDEADNFGTYRLGTPPSLAKTIIFDLDQRRRGISGVSRGMGHRAERWNRGQTSPELSILWARPPNAAFFWPKAGFRP
jgi:hypothetical protein